MANFDDVATNEHIQAIADAVRRVTRSNASMTIPEIATILGTLNLVEVREVDVSIEPGMTTLYGVTQYDKTIKHLFLFFPKDYTAGKVFGDIAPTVVVQDSGDIDFTLARAHVEGDIKSVVMLDFLLSDEATTRGYFIQNMDYMQLLETAVSGKLDKVTSSSSSLRVYGINADGSQTTKRATVSDADTIMMRNGAGKSHVTTPSSTDIGTVIANKEYVDGAGFLKNIGFYNNLVPAASQSVNEVIVDGVTYYMLGGLSNVKEGYAYYVSEVNNVHYWDTFVCLRVVNGTALFWPFRTISGSVPNNATAHYHVFATDGSGNNITIKYAVDPAIGTGAIMKRDANGRSQVNDPSANLDVANKRYVDGIVSGSVTKWRLASKYFYADHDDSGNYMYDWVNYISQITSGLYLVSCQIYIESLGGPAQFFYNVVQLASGRNVRFPISYVDDNTSVTTIDVELICYSSGTFNAYVTDPSDRASSLYSRPTWENGTNNYIQIQIAPISVGGQ